MSTAHFDYTLWQGTLTYFHLTDIFPVQLYAECIVGYTPNVLFL